VTKGKAARKLAARRDTTFVDVLEEEFVGLESGSALAGHLAWQAARLGRTPKLRIQLRRMDAVYSMVQSGVGIAVVPETVAKRCGRTMSLSTLRLTDAWATRQIIVCARRLDALPAHARRLVRHLVETAPVDA
jgi:DNA-binding transcriptional LysR family regulator